MPKAHVYGDNVDTDRIIPGKYTKTLDLSTLAAHVMEDIDPDFSKRFIAGDIIVAGDNFGCGSSREQAPLALKTVGVSLVIACFFARIFLRAVASATFKKCERRRGVKKRNDRTFLIVRALMLLNCDFAAPISSFVSGIVKRLQRRSSA